MGLHENTTAMSFPCQKCGACCRATKCTHLTEDGLCGIYEDRPLECRVDDKYDSMSTNLTREEFYTMTKIICLFLRTRGGNDE